MLWWRIGMLRIALKIVLKKWRCACAACGSACWSCAWSAGGSRGRWPKAPCRTRASDASRGSCTTCRPYRSGRRGSAREWSWRCACLRRSASASRPRVCSSDALGGSLKNKRNLGQCGWEALLGIGSARYLLPRLGRRLDSARRRVSTSLTGRKSRISKKYSSSVNRGIIFI